MKKKLITILSVLLVGVPLLAQNSHGNPFADLGYKAKIATLTDFEEFHDFEDVVEIGQVWYNTKKKEIVGFVGEKDHRIELIKDVISTSIDPLCEKYPWISPYAYCFNNPINVIDPDGLEGIVITGGEYDDSKRYKYNFVEPAITRLKEMVAAGGSEPITWVVMSAGYSDKDMEKFQAIAGDLGVGFQAIGSANELTNYLNSKDIGVSELSSNRQGDQITSMAVFGHGFVGSAEFGYNQSDQAKFSWSTNDVKNLSAGAFNNATIDLYTCNSATNVSGGLSLGATLTAQTGSTVTGYRGQSTYSHMNTGQGFGAKVNRNLNGFNTNGSVRMPQAGVGAQRVRFIPQ